jgi:hypothetical protein
MSTLLHGWIEVNTVQESNESLWFGIVDITAIAPQNYNIYSYLFGIRKKAGTQPLAERRGFPQDISVQSKNTLPSGEGIVGQTWILYQEFEAHLQSPYDWGWEFVFGTMHKLSEHYGSENVRLVVVFDNYG